MFFRFGKSVRTPSFGLFLFVLTSFFLSAVGVSTKLIFRDFKDGFFREKPYFLSIVLFRSPQLLLVCPVEPDILLSFPQRSAPGPPWPPTFFFFRLRSPRPLLEDLILPSPSPRVLIHVFFDFPRFLTWRSFYRTLSQFFQSGLFSVP